MQNTETQSNNNVVSLPSSIREAARKKVKEVFDSLEKHNIGEEKNRCLFGLLELEAFAEMFLEMGVEFQNKQNAEIVNEFEKALNIAKAWVQSPDSTMKEKNVAFCIFGEKVQEPIRTNI